MTERWRRPAHANESHLGAALFFYFISDVPRLCVNYESRDDTERTQVFAAVPSFLFPPLSLDNTFRTNKIELNYSYRHRIISTWHQGVLYTRLCDMQIRIFVWLLLPFVWNISYYSPISSATSYRFEIYRALLRPCPGSAADEGDMSTTFHLTLWFFVVVVLIQI